MSKLKLYEHNPTSGQDITHTVICLHGLGASGSDLLPLARELNLPSIRFVFPEAPTITVTINAGARIPAWYDILSLDFSSNVRADHLGVDHTCEQIKILIADEQARYGIKPEQIFLMGFSQGGSIALELGLHYDKPLAGIIGLSTLPPKGTKTFEQLASANQNTPIFLVHGQQDQVVPHAVGELLHAKLTALAYPLTWRSYMMGHEIIAQEIIDLKSWFSQILS